MKELNKVNSNESLIQEWIDWKEYTIDRDFRGAYSVYAVDMDGNSLSGWPITLNGNIEGGIVF